MAVEKEVVEGFGYEWQQFDQTGRPVTELQETFTQYFKIFPWESLPNKAVGFDLGCGSGRWANFVAGRVDRLYCIEASEMALDVAKKNLRNRPNCRFLAASAGEMPYADNSMDFGYALGVFHYTPDPPSEIKDCVKKLKPGAPLLVYMYYAFDNRPAWFRQLWRISDWGRQLISRSPWPVRYFISQVIAGLIYYPLTRLALLLEKLSFNVEMVPLSAYRHKSFYAMRTDALNRFGSRSEKRFTTQQLQKMMAAAGLEHITFNDTAPYWCVVGYKSNGNSPNTKELSDAISINHQIIATPASH